MKQLPVFYEIIVPVPTIEYSTSQGADFALCVGLDNCSVSQKIRGYICGECSYRDMRES